MLKTLTVCLLSLATACTLGEEAQAPPGEADSLHTSLDRSLASQVWFRAACDLPRAALGRIRRGYFEGRSPDIQFIPEPQHYFEGFAHSGPWAHLQRVPFVFYGPGFIKSTGSVRAAGRPTMADLAPTLARFIEFEMPSGRDGNPVREVLANTEEGADKPSLIVVAVLDGGGWNTLDRWSGRWPYLAKLMEDGISVTNATVGSSPSVTPPIHASLGTGTFPRDHGIVDIPVRDGDRVEDSWEEVDPANLLLTTLADEYDLATDNEALVGMIAESRWHLGMIGHGGALPGADRDIAALSDLTTDGGLYTNEEYYELPSYLEDRDLFAELVGDVDEMDGMTDGGWFAHRRLQNVDQLRFTPVWTLYQQEHIAQLIESEGFGSDEVADILFLNYKFIDHAGHKFGFGTPEMGEAVELSDAALRHLVRVLDSEVGKKRWLLAVTADHGVEPGTDRGWLIHQHPLTDRVEDHFGAERGELVLEDRPLGLWLDLDYAERNAIELEAIADFLTRYTLGDDLTGDEAVPQGLRETDRLFRAAFPTKYLPRIWRCATRR